MELVRKSLLQRLKILSTKISEDNLFLLASSISYYSALAIAPFALILLGVASYLGSGLQKDIVKQTSVTLSPEVGQMLSMVFKNVNEGVNVGSISGIIGALVLLSTASMVFLQFRYSFDVIYGYYDPSASKSVWESIREKLYAMFFVLLAAVLFIGSIFATTIFLKVFGGGDNRIWSSVLVFYANFMIYFVMFIGIHHFVPSRRPNIYDTLKISALSSVFFIIGNLLLASYLRKVAADSVYGAAGSILVFLTWAYYTSFTVFLSVEVFQYLKKTKMVK